MLLTRIQGRHILKLLAAGCQEQIAILHLDFLEGLETIDCESGAYNSDVTGSTPGHFFQDGAGVGLQPRIPAEAGLEAHAPFGVLQEQLIRKQARGLLTLAEIRIALVEVAFRNSME